MRNAEQLLFVFIFFLFSSLQAETTFGYISCTVNNIPETYNIGDDIQTVAAKQFIPGNSIAIDREFVGVFKNPIKIPAIINGWFMYTKDFSWLRFDSPPSKSWPPSNDIEPLLISIHLATPFLPYAFSPEAVEYLTTHGPVGARDLYTLKELQKHDIPSYFSGCLTLTLTNEYDTREDIIYAVDIDDDCVELIKSKTNTKVERIEHTRDYREGLNPEQRWKKVNDLLDKYKKAKCVVTSRLHAAMPCVAFETPVLLIIEPDNTRFSGLRELVRNCTKKEFISGNFNFDFNSPGDNPRDYIPIRDQLNEIVRNWVNKHK